MESLTQRVVHRRRRDRRLGKCEVKHGHSPVDRILSWIGLRVATDGRVASHGVVAPPKLTSQIEMWGARPLKPNECLNGHPHCPWQTEAYLWLALAASAASLSCSSACWRSCSAFCPWPPKSLSFAFRAACIF